ncbi:MAG: hypothetical protein GC160_17470 [Acidobacteria bacterium]|nr:hypothetical protein [Acidobacteriota bacterium]
MAPRPAFLRLGFLLFAMSLAAAGAQPAAAPEPDAQSNPPRNLLSRELPAWLDLGVNVRTRVERRDGLSFQAPFTDGLLLNRARFEAAVKPSQRWRVRLQLQDSRSAWLDPSRSRTGTDNPLDIRQLHLEVGAEDGDGWQARMGRQLLIFGKERVLAERNWNNVSPSWDAVRVGYGRGGDRIDAFAASQVQNDPGDVDAALSGADIAGFYAAVGSLLPHGRIEPYWFYNDRPRMQGVLVAHDAGVHTFGARAGGTVGAHWDYDAELTCQRGHAPQVSQRGWLGYAEVGFQPTEKHWGPRLFTVYEEASGDKDPNDGRVGTYDAGFGKRHSHLGEADAVGRSNLRTLESGVETTPAQALQLRVVYHHFRTARRRDGLYSTNGLLAVAAPVGRVSSSRIGDEVDLLMEWSPNRVWLLEGGVGRFFPGAWLQQALGSAPQRGIVYVSLEWTL